MENQDKDDSKDKILQLDQFLVSASVQLFSNFDFI